MIKSKGVLLTRRRRAGNTITDLQGSQLPSRSTEFYSWDALCDEKAASWILASQACSVNSPYDVVISKSGHDDVQLSNLGAPLKSRRFESYNVFKSQSSDGKVELDGMLISSAAKIDSNGLLTELLLPLVLIHSGPNDQDIEKFDSTFYWAQYLILQGYAVILP